MSRENAVHSTGVTPGWYGVDPETMDLKADPHERYRGLRESQPVNLTPNNEWRLSRYADIQHLLKHSHSGMRDLDGLIPGETREETDASRFMLRMDPPDHDRIRRLVSKAFTPRALDAIRPSIQPLVDQELDKAVTRGEMDLVSDLALMVPAASMCAMLGVPFEDRDRLSRLVSVATYRLAKRALPDLQEEAEAAIFELAEYMFALIEQRRQQPSDDILGLMVSAEEAGDRLDTEELLQQSIGLLIAGLETTIGLIANGMIAFSRNPEEFRRLGRSPDLIDSAVEECLRFEPSVPMTLRVLWEDMTIDGITIPANATVFGVLIGANRDPAVFSDPDRFDIGRAEARHCSFGGGIHFCLGSHLARMNAAMAFEGMAKRFDSVSVDESAIEWAPSLFRIPGKVPARVVPR
ncbi:cytochrome P450 [Parahalioglobus pacificus]|uniref:Cytochrome P450 n=1 Tax=Parahalioglobus pacificus TaxID=930806 RepID=A0A919CIA9_9GAMM|nr:cytochrome P450 [Halioglobus pacificus]GHD28235.1 cytochrome P450 [Halioglobus pacificus]